MGWFWGTSDSHNNTTTTSSNAVNNLDPKLREFLEKEAPRQPPPAPPLPSKPAEPAPVAKSVPQISTTQPEPSKPVVPPESLFQDGRYAHIWKTYTPYAEIENTGKSEQEKITDIVEAMNDRKSAIGRAALENCAEENWELNECFRVGGWGQRVNLCKAENRRFNRCYEMQSRFMKALGYLSLEQRTPEEEERIQMHADKLYHRMLVQEKETEEAKKEGRLIPDFQPLMSKENFAAVLRESGLKTPYATNTTAPTTTPTSSVALKDNLPIPSMPGRGEEWGDEKIPEEIKREMDKRLARKSAEEKALEERALEAELTVASVVGKEVSEILAEQHKARMERKAQGRPTLGDRVKDFWGT